MKGRTGVKEGPTLGRVIGALERLLGAVKAGYIPAEPRLLKLLEACEHPDVGRWERGEQDGE